VEFVHIEPEPLPPDTEARVSALRKTIGQPGQDLVTV
jgi:hypothetical protein